MGIEKLNKKNPPTPASSPSATSTQVEEYLYIWYKYFYLFTVEVALGELAGVAGEEKTNFANANCKLLSWSSLESSRAYLTNQNNKR